MAETIKDPDVTGFLTGSVHETADGNVPNQVSWWEYARTVRNIARNARITNPTGTGLAAFKTFIDVFVKWDDATQAYIGTRPELGYKLNIRAVSSATNYVGDSTVEPAQILVKILEQISRAMKQYPLNLTEQTAVTILNSVSNTRNLGVTPYFGGVAGSYDNGGLD
jgi:hypothetical protein